ncbi:hypothetical protein Tco_0072017 [Tanacetum coccineum]
MPMSTSCINPDQFMRCTPSLLHQGPSSTSHGTTDASISRRNRVNWHFAKDDPMFTTIKVVFKHKDTQLYGAILPDELTNEAIKDFESYKEYYAIASGAEPPKTKACVKKKQTGSDKTKTPPTTKGKRLKTLAKAAKPAKKKQTAKTPKAKGLTVLSEVALTEAEQIELATKRILIQTHSSYANSSGTDEGTSNKPGVLDVPTYASDDEQISWKSIDKEDDNEVAMSGDDDDDADNQENDDNDDGQDHEGPDDDNEQTDSDNDGDDFVHPKFSTHDEEDNEEEESDEVTHGANVEGEELDEEETNEEDEVNELYSDVNVNLEGRDTVMTDVPRTIIQTTQVIEDTHVIITLVNPEGQQQSSSVSSGFISNMLNPSPDTAVSSIPNIVDAYLANKMHEVVKTDVQLQSNKLKDEAQAENADFINKLDENIKKIIKDQVKEQVKAQVSKILSKIEKTIYEQLEAEVLTRSSNESKTSHAIAANLSELELKKILIDKMESNKSIYIMLYCANPISELELKKILIDKMESNKSIYRSDEQKNLYKALVDAYESDKLILDTYGDNVLFKRCQDDDDKDEESFALCRIKTRGSAYSTSLMRSSNKLISKEPAHLEFETRVTEDQPDEETSQLPDWFQKTAKPLTPDRD